MTVPLFDVDDVDDDGGARRGGGVMIAISSLSSSINTTDCVEYRPPRNKDGMFDVDVDAVEEMSFVEFTIVCCDLNSSRL